MVMETQLVMTAEIIRKSSIPHAAAGARSLDPCTSAKCTYGHLEKSIVVFTRFHFFYLFVFCFTDLLEFFLIFYMGLWLQLVFAGIYMFKIDIILTEMQNFTI